MKRIVYVDHAATTPVRREVMREMMPYFSEKYGNPSSVYSIASESKDALELARERVAKSINAEVNEIYFTSGGSESDNLCIKGVAYANKHRGNHIITTKIEHPAVLNTCETLEKEGYKITYLNVDKEGVIDLEELRRSITPFTILISVMFANNEIGTLQPINEIGEIARRNNIYFHTDAVQAVGNVHINVKEMNIDLLSISGHKLYGPKGTGAVYIKNGVKINKIQDGGHQENDMRAGTENIPGIVGLGKATEISTQYLDRYSSYLTNLRNYCIKEVRRKIPRVKLNGHETNRLPGNINFSFEGIDGKTLILNLSMRGICASGGSACSSKNSKPSHVLKAIGVPDTLANGSLRITLGNENNKEDVDYIIRNLAQIVSVLRMKNK